MLEFILRHMNLNNKMIEKGRENIQLSGSEFNKRLYDYLCSKFKKLKKTK